MFERRQILHDFVRRKRAREGTIYAWLVKLRWFQLLGVPVALVVVVFLAKDLETAKVIEFVVAAVATLVAVLTQLMLQVKDTAIPALDATLRLLDTALRTDPARYDKYLDDLEPRIFDGALK